MFSMTKIKVVIMKRVRDILLALSIGSIAKLFIDGSQSIGMVILFSLAFTLTVLSDLTIMQYDKTGGE